MMQASKRSSKSLKPNKISAGKGSQSRQQLFNDICKRCCDILSTENTEEVNRQLSERRINSNYLKQQKMTMLNSTIRAIMNETLVENQDLQILLEKIVKNLNSVPNKCYEFFWCLKYFSLQDFEFQYMLLAVLNANKQPVSFYLRYRTMVINSFLNKKKKENLAAVEGSECNSVQYSEQWFKLIKRLFTVSGICDQETVLVESFLSTVKQSYGEIKMSSNEQFNGSEVFKICQIMYDHLCQSGAVSFYKQKLKYKGQEQKSCFDQNKLNEPFRTKQMHARRVLSNHTISNVDTEDQELIRVLSYQDPDIARLLQKKHEKMIAVISEDVQQLRQSIDEQKHKYFELFAEKQAILQSNRRIKQLALEYIIENNINSQNKLLKEIEKSTALDKSNPAFVRKIEKAKKSREDKRLIQIIEEEEREID